MFTAPSLYGITPQAPAYGPDAAPIADQGVTDPAGDGWRRLVSPQNPLFWLGVVLAVTLGAAGVAGSVRLGRAQLAVDLDKSD